MPLSRAVRNLGGTWKNHRCQILDVKYFRECDFFFSPLPSIFCPLRRWSSGGSEGKVDTWWWWVRFSEVLGPAAQVRLQRAPERIMRDAWQYNVKSHGGAPPRAIKRLMCTRIRRKSCAECVINVSASRDGHRNRLTSSRKRRETRRLGVKIWWCSNWRRFMPRQPRTRNCWTSVSSGPTIGWGRSRRLSSRDSPPTRYESDCDQSRHLQSVWIKKKLLPRRLDFRATVPCAMNARMRFKSGWTVQETFKGTSPTLVLISPLLNIYALGKIVDLRFKDLVMGVKKKKLAMISVRNCIFITFKRSRLFSRILLFFC